VRRVKNDISFFSRDTAMTYIFRNRIILVIIFLLFLGCGRKEERSSGEQKSKVEEAVGETVTKEFKMYEGAKAALEKTEKEAQERRDEEKEVK
jgi:hypothetical protein